MVVGNWNGRVGRMVGIVGRMVAKERKERERTKGEKRNERDFGEVWVYI